MLDQSALVKAIVEPLLNGEDTGGDCDLSAEMKKKLFEIAYASARAIANHLTLGEALGLNLTCRELGEMCAQFKRLIRPKRDAVRIYESIKRVVAVLHWSFEPDNVDDDRLLMAIDAGFVHGVNTHLRSGLSAGRRP